MSPAYPGTTASGQSGCTASGHYSCTATATTGGDALLATLAPIWQVVIGGCVLVTLVAASARLARRGRSRMTTALLVVGAAIVGLAIIGVLTSEH
ncbi:hypothetical protein ACNTMW_31430 [Planosporangium sp. 12N6]|uniref:hypothetical protein n=1 Tax=Planosporangium spinosum TaxID=3402278 RepID=UPI003CF95791